MKRPLLVQKSLLVLTLVVLGACDTTVKKEETAGLNYGPKPTRWREEIKSYLDLRLVNPKEALVEYRSEPKQLYQRDTVLRDSQYGWATCVWVNEKKDGKFAGPYPMTFFMRDDKIVAVNGGPDENSLMASRYAREQCAQLTP
ncbi:MAG TPA: hypothetical protein VNU96_05705 [Burkholderiales bacterium]|jgi:hypothetical protein|nr:hypothetical protein [Burkholderiales bacterium]